jgi:hypothetical protein
MFVVSISANRALAILAFRKEFEEYYKVNEPQTDAQKALAERAKIAKCNICHVDGEEKKVRNAYGAELDKLLDKENFGATRRKDEPEKVQAEIREALDKVAAEKGPTDETYGERIEAGQLPVAPAAE